MLHVENLRIQRSPEFCLTLPRWQLADGQHALLRGPSGCGKSTLLAALAGLLQPTQGRVVLDGVDLASLTADALRTWRAQHVGIVFQALHLIPVLSVRENAELVQSLAGRPDRKYLDETLDALGLSTLQHRRPAQLSGGQQQRAAVLRAIAHRPRWLFADEPTSALDARNTIATLQVLRAAAKLSSAQLIVASHDDRLKEHFGQWVCWSEQAWGEALVEQHFLEPPADQSPAVLSTPQHEACLSPDSMGQPS